MLQKIMAWYAGLSSGQHFGLYLLLAATAAFTLYFFVRKQYSDLGCLLEIAGFACAVIGIWKIVTPGMNGWQKGGVVCLMLSVLLGGIFIQMMVSNEPASREDGEHAVTTLGGFVGFLVLGIIFVNF